MLGGGSKVLGVCEALGGAFGYKVFSDRVEGAK